MPIDICPPLIYAVGDADQLPLRLTEWLGAEDVDSVTLTADSASLTPGAASITGVPYTIKGKVTLAGDAVLLPFEVADGDVEIARLLVDIDSTNATRKLRSRAIPIRIVG